MAPANKRLLILFCYLLAGTLTAQSNIRAWYAKGQVWIIWNTRQPLPQTFAIYKSNRAFTQIKNAAAIGRLFPDEYFPGGFIRQTGDSQFVYKIPKPDGGLYELQQGEALFVETPVNSGKAFYGVVEWGDDKFVSGQNATALPVEYTIDPVHDPVSCHLQYQTSLNTGHRTSWYALWLLGSQNENKGRPDFPVLANAYKNGIPAMFIVSESPEMDTSDGRKIPGTLLLHDEDGNAAQYLPDRFPQLDIKPHKGISIAHQDELYNVIHANGETRIRSTGTSWFGYAGNYDPFIPGAYSRPDEVLINYTQRRMLWINKWLIQNYQMDPDRVAIQGLGTGACGAVALGKCFPRDFSTICAFDYRSCKWNNEAMAVGQGSVEKNPPTNLLKNKKEAIRILEVLDLNTPVSTFRDFPLLRIWIWKNDEGQYRTRGPGLVNPFLVADSIGMGMQIQWDEGSPSMDRLGTNWIKGVLADQQTQLDNLSTQENHGSRQSFPAFFNHRLDPNNPDPGNRLSGVNNGKGALWGSWGGYHRWDLKSIQDNQKRWSVTAWLSSESAFENDNCPVGALTASLALRKPQHFQPKSGTTINWKAEDIITGQVMESGTIIVGSDDLVKIPRLTLYRSDIRKVRISIEDPQVTTFDASTVEAIHSLLMIPNLPGYQNGFTFFSNYRGKGSLRINSMTGPVRIENIEITEGMNVIRLVTLAQIPPGTYFLELLCENSRLTSKWVKIY